MKYSLSLLSLSLVFLWGCSTRNSQENTIAEDTRHLVRHNPTDRSYTTYFHENYYDQLAINNLMLFFTSENEQETPKALGIIINHTRIDPMSIQQYQLIIDGEEFIYTPQNLYTIDDPEKEKTIISCQDTLTSQSLEMVKDLINSEQAKIIYIGENDSVSHELDAKVKKQLSQVIEAYEAMGGELP